jgi:lipoprotein-anchoring transpeptidase ErfK/SrfK
MRLTLISACCFLSLSAGVFSQAPVITDVVAAQVMLDRAGFSSGEIDGAYGVNVRRAVVAFQTANNLPTSGLLDSEIWRALSGRTAGQPPLTTYLISDADVAGPFEPNIPSDLVEQAKLETLAYRNPLEAISEKFHSSPSLLRKLNPGATFERVGEQLTVPNVEIVEPPSRPRRNPGATSVGTSGLSTDISIIVTKETSALTVESGDGRILFHAPVTTGSEHDPLPVGTWKVTNVQQMPEFHYNPELFWDANPSHAKARVAPGPNNPVGTLWIGLSKEHYGIHGSPEPSRIAHRQSHGCVRLTNWDAQRVARWAAPGIKVIFR